MVAENAPRYTGDTLPQTAMLLTQDRYAEAPCVVAR